MKQQHSIQLMLWTVLALLPESARTVSLMYTMGVRRVFESGSEELEQPKKSKQSFVVTGVPILYRRRRHITSEDLSKNLFEKTTMGGCLINLRYNGPYDFWCEAGTGVEREQLSYCGTQRYRASRTGFDDILVSLGRNIHFNSRTQLVPYLLSGIPTYRRVTEQEANATLVGTRFFSLGAGAELSHSFIHTAEHTLVGACQVRFLHSFNRNWYPILPCDAKLQPGNSTDLLLSLQYRHGPDSFELSYNPTFFTNQAALLTSGAVHNPNFVREGMYARYAHTYAPGKVFSWPLIVGAGIFVAHTRRFDAQTFACWIHVTGLF